MSNKTVFEVVSARQKNGKLEEVKHAGISRMKEKNNFYKLNLNMWPSTDYFISKNFTNQGYTIFSKIVMDGNDVKFQNPVGYARILKDLKTHMKLHFEMPNLSLYMCLFPTR